MVLRKPLPADTLVPAPLSQAANRPPYPTTPSDEHPPTFPSPSPNDQPVYSPDLSNSPAFNLQPVQEAQQKNKKKNEDDDASDYSDNEWDQSDDEAQNDLPDTLKIGGAKPVPIPQNKKDGSLPDVLRAGPPSGVAPKKSQEAITPDVTGATSSSYGAISNASGSSVPLQTNNPYLKMQHTGQSNFGGETSHQIWGDAPSHAQTYADPVELPTYQTPATPTKPMHDLSLNDQSSPQPPVIAVEPTSPWATPSQGDNSFDKKHEPGMDASSLDAFAQSYGATDAPGQSQRDHVPHTDHAYNPPAYKPAVQAANDQSQRDNVSHMDHTHNPPTYEPAAQALNTEHTSHQPPTNPSIFDTPVIPQSQEEPVSIPPANTQEPPPPVMPPGPPNNGLAIGTGAGPESPNSDMDRQRKETYQIKQIRWHDVQKQGIRTSPILTQNLNGPCPLLALVNALVLSTPANMETALVETLRTREQVTLGLLLDAVFDELMSGRRGGAAQELPDVSELYKFLLQLHTGLNVNPMFVKDADSTDGTSAPAPSLAQNPGGFENTREMKLYRTFNIPLMHGWLPEPGSDAYIAFERIAKSYDTSQYVQFQEEELDAKLQTGEALTTDEQQMFTDIHAIKEFLNIWPTQLTTHGLRTMKDNLASGQVAILFRNDHFTTLYKDPRTDKLVTLVTDQGYSSHDEIVWETLVDVNGQGSELFSGDFRPVGGNSMSSPRPRDQPPVRSLLDVDENEGWTTVGQQHASATNLDPPTSPSSNLNRTEQEDHDLALALQLQEEEEDQHRRAQEERRRQENRLSETAISTQAQARPGNRRTSRTAETPPVIPPRRNPAVNRPVNSNEPAPPPTYEEASTAPQYHPPAGHPASQNAPIRPQRNTHQQGSYPANPQSPAHQMPQGGRLNGLPGRHGRRQSGGMVGPNGGSEDRDKCVVM